MTTIERLTEDTLPDERISTVVLTARMAVSEVLDNGLLGIAGPCAETDNPIAAKHEGAAIHQLTAELPDFVGLRRAPMWKPRSNPKDWSGIETTHPELTVEMMREATTLFQNVAVEIGFEEHLAKYGQFLSFGWIGGRNFDNLPLQIAVVTGDPTLPLGIKNGLDGNVVSLVDRVIALRKLRPDGAPIVPIYRGGENATNASEWEAQYKRIVELTDGHMVVDTAHGGEMAHDPEGRFKKTKVGQIACLEHVIELASKGFAPAGIMIEASDVDSPTDPNIPFEVALQGMRTLTRTTISN